MKIANLILVHKNPEQVSRLLKTLNHPDVYNFIHLDKKANSSQFKFLEDTPRLLFLKIRVDIHWGGFSMVNAILKGIMEILEFETKLDYINIMSGQDVLLKPIEMILKKAMENPELEYLECKPIHSNWEANVKLFTYHFSDSKIPGQYRLQMLINFFQKKRRFPLSIEIREGSMWMMITREAADYIIKFINQKPVINKFFKHVWGPDEFFFHTILYNSPFTDRITFNNFRHIDWSEKNAHPKIFTIADSDALLNSPHLIARKFDSDLDDSIIKLLERINS